MLESSLLNSTLDQVLRGQPDAFLGIVRAYSPMLRTWLSSQLFRTDEVDDLAQETFIAAYRSLHTFRRTQDFGAWLRGIARNKLLRHFEQSGRRTTQLEKFRQTAATLLADDLEVAAASTQAEQLQAMLACISRLPDRIRHVVRSLLDGGKAAALAQELGTSVGAIYQLHYRALGLLRECITQELGYER